MTSAHNALRGKWFDAVERGDASAVRQLAKQGAVVEWTTHHNKTALLLAAETGRVACMETLLSLGANIDAVDVYNENLLHAAAGSSSLRVLDMALEQAKQGLDLHQQGKGGRTPLAREISQRQSAARIDKWLAAGTQPSEAFNMPLAMATRADDPATMQQLVAAGATLDYRFNPDDVDGWRRLSALHEAAAEGAAKALGWLLEQGVAVDAPNSDGDTALLVTCKKAQPLHLPVVQRLLEAGANPLHCNLDGKNGMQVLAGTSGDAVRRLLESHSQARKLQHVTPLAAEKMRPRL